MTHDGDSSPTAQSNSSLMNSSLMNSSLMNSSLMKMTPQSSCEPALCVSVEQQSAWVRNFNPLTPEVARWPTRAGVFEPLQIFNTLGGTWTPWLALEHTWDATHRVLRFELRDGVRWSDGAPFTADDVRATFQLLREHPSLDGRRVWRFLSDVRSPSRLQVEFEFEHVFVPGLEHIAQQPIVPAHIWSHVDDPVGFTNSSPVGTGPFTEVVRFEPEVFELARNPTYWQPGRPKVPRLRMRAFADNDEANKALMQGLIDWGGNFVPVVDKTFVAANRKHHGYWFPLFGNTVFLYPNTTRPPFDDPTLRHAVSLAIHRPRLVESALFGYSKPAHPTGLSDGHEPWRIELDPASTSVHYDVARASRMLHDGGYVRDAQRPRRDATGRELRFHLDVVKGWSDWVQAAEVIARDLQAIGIFVEVRQLDFGEWMARLQQGSFELSLSWSMDGTTPYSLYRSLMGSSAVVPVGEFAGSNWHRCGDPIADELLTRFEAVTDATEQRDIAAQLQRRFVELLPAIPLFPNPLWGTFNTSRYRGFPTPNAPYAKPAPYAEPECLLVLTMLEPSTDKT